MDILLGAALDHCGVYGDITHRKEGSLCNDDQNAFQCDAQWDDREFSIRLWKGKTMQKQ